MGDSWIDTLDVKQWTQDLLNAEMSGFKIASDKTISGFLKQEKLLNLQQSNYTSLQNLLTTFYSSVQALPTSFDPTYVVTPSDSTVANASVPSGTTVPATTHTLTVTNLATAEQYVSAMQASSSAALGITDAVTFTVGSSHFTVNVGATDSLATIAQSINDAATKNDMGVTAYVLPINNAGTTEYKLFVTSNQTGLANKVTISEGGPGSLGFTENTAAADATFTFDNIPMSSATNTGIAVAGLDINLTKGGGATTNLVVNATNQTANATTAIQNLINAYNAVDLFIETTNASSFTPDLTLSTILRQLQGAFAKTVNSVGLSSIGIIQNTNAAPVTITMPNGKTLNYTPHGMYVLNADTSNGLPIFATEIADSTGFAQIQSLFTDSTNGINTALSKLMKPNLGDVWKDLNAPNQGFDLIGRQLGKVQTQLDAEDQRVKDQEAVLVRKYAVLSQSLEQMQLKFRYVEAQMAAMGK